MSDVPGRPPLGPPPSGPPPSGPPPSGPPPPGPPPGWQPPPSGPPGGGRRRRVLLASGVLVVVVLAGVVALVVVLGGGSGPRDTAEAFFDRAGDRDCSQAELLSNASVRAEEESERADGVDEAVQACEDAKDSGDYLDVLAGCSVDIGDVDQDDDAAEVSFEVSGCDDAANDVDDGTIVMVRENDEWRIDDFQGVPEPSEDGS